jgi:hypothetical protein
MRKSVLKTLEMLAAAGPMLVATVGSKIRAVALNNGLAALQRCDSFQRISTESVGWSVVRMGLRAVSG